MNPFEAAFLLLILLSVSPLLVWAFRAWLSTARVVARVEETRIRLGVGDERWLRSVRREIRVLRVLSLDWVWRVR